MRAGRILAIAVAGCGASLIALHSMDLASAAEKSAADGLVHVPAFDLPLSAAISPEAREYLAHPRLKAPPEPQDGPFKNQQEADASARKYISLIDEQFAKPLADEVAKAYPAKFTATQIGGVPVEDFRPVDGVAPANTKRVLISLRGGSFGPIGSKYLSRIAATPMTNLGRVRVVSVMHRDTSLKHPAATEDVVAVYQALLKEYPAKNIGIYGCSAGGMLTSWTTAWLVDKKLPLPGAIGISGAGTIAGPGGDGTYFAAISNGAPVPGTAPPVSSESDRIIGRFAYLGGVPLNDPLIDPLRDPRLAAKFPPTLLMTSTRDEFSSTLEAHRVLTRAGVDASLYVFDGLPHCFTTLHFLPEAKEATQLSYRFFDQHLGH